MYESDFPITEQPMPLLETDNSPGLLERFYAKEIPNREERIRAGRRMRYRRDRTPVEKVLTSLIPLADALDRLCSPETERLAAENEVLANWLNALQAVRRRLRETMQRAGLTPVESVGKPVDLDIHEVVEVRNTSGAEDKEVVVEEVQKGYTYDNRVVRDAKVVVERPMSGASPQGAG